MTDPQQNHMPLVSALHAYRNARSARFHIPGHAGEVASGSVFHELFGGVLPFDVTEIEGLDDLHQPEDCIADAERLAAHFYGSDQTFFLVQGSSLGNQAMIAAHCRQGDVVLVQRNVHQSIVHGLLLAEVRVVWLMPEVDLMTGIASSVSIRTLTEALQANQHSAIRAVILQRPNYYGQIGADFQQIVSLAHDKCAMVMVDEAHGAHFGIHHQLPQSSLQLGADVVVQSTHKMLGSLTMGAMLHVQGPLVDVPAIRRTLRVLQTSSPSYLIMASLDAIRGALQHEGIVKIERVISRSTMLRKLLDEHQHLEVVDAEDPCKIVIFDRHGSRTGFELKKWFEERGCIPELADLNHVVFVITWQTPDEFIDRLQVTCLKYSCLEQSDVKKYTIVEFSDVEFSFEPKQMPSLSQWLHGNSHEFIHSVPIELAEGCICADSITPYPPGIPIVFPGELIRASHVKNIFIFYAAGAMIKGTHKHEKTDQLMVRIRSHKGENQE